MFPIVVDLSALGVSNFIRSPQLPQHFASTAQRSVFILFNLLIMTVARRHSSTFVRLWVQSCGNSEHVTRNDRASHAFLTEHTKLPTAHRH